MLESTNDVSQNGKRLVLGFDAGCTSCTKLAKQIEEQVDGKLEVRSLRDPQMEHWRKQAFGEDPPWAPTLVEVGGAKAKGWTGVGLGVRLSRSLGPLAAWRLMQAIGESGSKGVDPETQTRDATLGRRGLTRGGFIKGALGSVAAMSILSGTGTLSSSASAREGAALKSISHRDLDGQELGRLAREVAGRKDLTNVMGSSWSRRMQTSRITRVPEKGQDINVLSNGDSPSVGAGDGGISVSGDGVVVKAAKHNLEGGNGLLAVTYVADNRITAYYEFDEPVDGVRSKAAIWELDEENDVVALKTASHNGVLDSPIPRAESGSVHAQRVYCGGCGSRKNRRKVTLCSNVSYRCLIINCGICILGAPGILKLACVYVYCPYLLYPGTGTCCKRGGTRQACAGCPR